jgi:hypothetical protein
VSEVFTGQIFFAINSHGRTEIKNLGCSTPDLVIYHQAECKFMYMAFFAINSRGKSEIKDLGCTTTDLVIYHRAEYKFICENITPLYTLIISSSIAVAVAVAVLESPCFKIYR